MAPWTCVVFLALHWVDVASSCQVSVTTKRLSQRCVTKNNTFIAQTRLDLHICIMDCVRRTQCLGFNYDLSQKKCYPFDEQCQSLETDEKFEMTFMGILAELCLKWLPPSNTVISTMVSMYRCHANGDYSTCHVARLLYGPNTLPGKFDGFDVYSVLNGVKHYTGSREVLHVLPGCQVEWVTYNAGSPIPRWAVLGGYLANDSGSLLYVIRGVVYGYIVPGYYDSIKEEAYVDYDGPRRVDQIEMLILKS